MFDVVTIGSAPLGIIETLSDEFPGGFLRFPGVSYFFPGDVTILAAGDPGPAGRPRARLY